MSEGLLLGPQAAGNKLPDYVVCNSQWIFNYIIWSSERLGMNVNADECRQDYLDSLLFILEKLLS